MQLLGFLKHQSKKKPEAEPLFALVIFQDSIQAAVWKTSGNTVDIISKARVSYQGEWEDIIEAADQALSDCTQTIVNGESINKVIFGLSAQHVEGEKIAPEYLTGLKKLCSELSLNPSGFVVIPEAVAYLLERKEQVPPTAILVGVEKTSLTVTIVKAGKVLGSMDVPCSDDPALDLEEAFKSFRHIEILPSKIFLYDGEKTIKSLQQKLLDYPWEKNRAFLHVPKISILENYFALEAVILAGAEELLIDTTAKLVIDEKSGRKEPLPEIDEIPKQQAQDDEKEKLARKAISSKETISEKEISDASEFGFVRDKDIAEIEHERQEIQPKDKKRPKMEVVVTEEVEPFSAQEKSSLLKKRIPHVPLPAFELNFLTDWLRYKKLILAIFFFIFFLTGGMAVSLYWAYPKATVTLLVDPKPMSKQMRVVFASGDGQDNQAKAHMPAQLVEVEVDGSKTIPTTGKKTTGTRAKGEVTIYNKTTKEKTFSKGSVLIGPKNLSFTLDKDVTVASISDVIVGTPGKAIAPVTASKIGSESNLPAGSDFSFKDFPVTSYAARNEKAFTGGTSREITVVDEKDQDEVLNGLLKELKEKGRNELQKKLKDGYTLVEGSVEANVIEKSFSHKIGEETEELTLTAKIGIKGVSYKQEDLINGVRKQFNEVVPENYSFSEKQIETKIVKIYPAEENTVEADVEVIMNLMPSIDTEAIRELLAGKTFKEAEGLLSETKGIVGYEVKFTRKLPLKQQRFPFLSSNIDIKVAPR